MRIGGQQQRVQAQTQRQEEGLQFRQCLQQVLLRELLLERGVGDARLLRQQRALAGLLLQRKTAARDCYLQSVMIAKEHALPVLVNPPSCGP